MRPYQEKASGITKITHRQNAKPTQATGKASNPRKYSVAASAAAMPNSTGTTGAPTRRTRRLPKRARPARARTNGTRRRGSPGHHEAQNAPFARLARDQRTLLIGKVRFARASAVGPPVAQTDSAPVLTRGLRDALRDVVAVPFRLHGLMSRIDHIPQLHKVESLRHTYHANSVASVFPFSVNEGRLGKT